MNLFLSYLGRSTISSGPAGVHIALAPNLRRDRVSYSGTLRQPLRFREAISALHDVVISDLRYKPKDHSDFKAYLAEMKERENVLRRGAAQQARAEIMARKEVVIPEGLETDFRKKRTLYWNARQQYSNYLLRNDPEMWRLLMPCDPVITVAPDVLFFECFSGDESSYGCLSVDRGAFASERDVALGTTNVDYSWALYEHFQNLRSYRATRFLVDPAGFEVRTEQGPDYREEKIDLPPSWLRGFMQLQAAQSLPMRRVPVSREGLYNVLAWLKRHRAHRPPRAARSHDLLADVTATFKERPAQSFAQVRQRTGASAPYLAAALNRLALLGQLVHDLPAGLYRWRPIMPVALSVEQIGPENPETAAARDLARRVQLTRDERLPNGLRLLGGTVPERPAELLLDPDRRMLRGKCTCSHHFPRGLRRGPCRRLQP